MSLALNVCADWVIVLILSKLKIIKEEDEIISPGRCTDSGQVHLVPTLPRGNERKNSIGNIFLMGNHRGLPLRMGRTLCLP